MAPKLPNDWSSVQHISVGILGPKDTYSLFVPYGKSVPERDQEWFDDLEVDYNWWCAGLIFYRDIFQSKDNLGDYRSTEFSFYHDRKRKTVQAGSPSENKTVEEYAEDRKNRDI